MPNKTSYLKRHAPVIVWLVALAVAAGALLICEHHQLWKIQKLTLFLWTPLFFEQQMVVPGGLLTWVGCFFTQFLYIPWLGVLLLCGWWFALLLMMRQTFRTPDHCTLPLLIPVALLLITNMYLGYWIYMLKLHGHFFVTTIGTTMVVALLWAFRAIPDLRIFRSIPGKGVIRGIFLMAVCAIGYPLMGIYGLAATLLMGLWAWRLSASRTEAVMLSALALICVIAVPLVGYNYIYDQVNLTNIWWAKLPLFFITEEYHAYYIPYYLLLAFFIVMVTFPIKPTTPTQPTTPTKPTKPTLKSHLSPAFVIHLLTAVVLVLGVWHFWYKDENFHHELAMQHAIEELDWGGVLDEAARQDDEPTRAIVMMRNLALSRLGKQGDEMFRYKNGSKNYAAPFGMRLMLVAGPQIYYQYGMLNYCNRLCTEIGVEFGYRPEDYQLLVNCALLDNDAPLARKYIGILKQTLFYSHWAEEAEELLLHPGLIAKDAAREPITHMLHYKNYLGGDQGYTERFLMRQLASSTSKDDPIFQEQTLLATLWTRDMDQFWYHFYDYVALHPNERMPRYYQEAAYLYGQLQDRPDLDRMPFDQEVKDTFHRFMEFAQQYEGKDEITGRAGLYPFFGDTYYYDYYLMSHLPEY